MKKINSLIKRLALACLMLFAGLTMSAQNIELNPSSKSTQISTSTLKGFNSTFSFNNIESVKMTTEAGDFSALSIAKTVNGGELGGPSLPIARELVAVPFGATPVVKVVNFSTTDYKLSDFGIERVYPQQPSYSKDTKVEDMVFHYNEKAYQTRSLETAPEVTFEVLGTMRGIQLGALQVEPVSYNPTNNTIRVYNDIQVEVFFENADVALTEQRLVETYSPYFDVIYKQLFNSRAIADVYEDHPDLYATPVHMLVIANRMFEEVMQPWLAWKTEKGFYVDVKYTDEIGALSNDIKACIQEQYELNHPSFLVVFGDKNQVVPSVNVGPESGRVSDLYYSSIDGDEYPEIYHSRMACETVEEMEALIDKVLTYEQYTMADPSYLNNVLMIAGVDGYWNPIVGKPAIQYATYHYFNEEHGFENVYEYLGSNYSGCYSHLSEGVGFANYTAHGSETSWADPSFTVTDVNNLTNTDKYFWAMGNCCNAADWGYGSVSLAEAFIRGNEKGAWGYIGSCPVTYWWEDYYFGVGATTVTNEMPAYEATTMGAYDAYWMDDVYNPLSSVPFVGNLAVAYAHTTGGYQTSSSVQYYFEAYHTLGDGSVMPYRTQPTENEVSHMPTLPIGFDYYTVSAVPGSYVGISKDGVLYGAGMINETGTTDIPLTPITTGGDVKIVVTHPQHIPYTQIVPAAAMDGPYLTVTELLVNEIPVNEETYLSFEIGNVGTEATTAESTISISCEEDFVTIVDGEASLTTLAVDATSILENAFAIKVAEGIENGTKIKMIVTITCGEDVWEGNISLTVVAPKINFKEFVFAGSFVPGESQTVAAKFENIGGYLATNVVVKASSTSEYLTIENDTFEVGTVDVAGIATALFDVAVSEDCPVAETIEINFELTADNGVIAEGVGMLRNTCIVEFILHDSYGDGWNGSTLSLDFDNGDPSIQLGMDGGNDKTHTLEIGSGIKVTVTFNVNGNYWTDECSYKIQYQGGEEIYNSNGEPNIGYNTEFVVNCGGGSGGEIYDAVENLEAVAEGEHVTLTWEGTAVSYIVERNGVQIAETEETSYEDTLVTDGVYTYSVTAVYEGGQSMPAMVTIDFVGVEEENEIGFSIYPNPAKDYVNISTNAMKYEYQIINSLGQVVLSGTAEGESQISVIGMNKGVYFLKVVADGETRISKMLIQ